MTTDDGQPFLAPHPPPPLPDPLPNCARRDCQAPRATWFNFSTRWWYCQPCAFRINEHAPGLCVRGVKPTETMS